MFFHCIFHHSPIKINIWVFTNSASAPDWNTWMLFLGLFQTCSSLSRSMHTLPPSSNFWKPCSSQVHHNPDHCITFSLPPLGDSFFGSWIGFYLHKPQHPFSHPSDTKQPPLLWWTSLLPKPMAWWSQVSPRLELMPGISSTPQKSVDKP
jgi:hypothetical protein